MTFSGTARALPISIHALHEESDLGCNTHLLTEDVISIHALHEESDLAHNVLPYD